MNRIEQLMQAMPSDVDAVLITSPVNRRYYTGFASSAGVILATRKQAWFIIDSRYREAAQAAVTSCEIILQDKLYEQLTGLLQQAGVQILALESEKVSLAACNTYREKLPVELVTDETLSKAINRQRCIKSAEEIAKIQEAHRLTDQTFTHILDFIKPGRTEREIALEMEFYSRRVGSEGASFAFIVVSGKNSSLPHGVPSDKKVEQGDFVTMDFGCLVNGYCSDMTRTIAVGEVGEKQRDVYDTVLRAQLAALAEIAPGRVCREIDQVAREIIDAGSYKGTFGHGLGHSLGLMVHEEPRFNTLDKTVLEPGMVMSVEPGIYLEGEFGVRIEDIVVVTQDGILNLAASPKELLVL